MADINEILYLDEEFDHNFHSASPPIVQSNNFIYNSVDEMAEALKFENKIPFYTRGSNPTIDLLRKKIAALEKTEDALAFASGSAAISAAILANVSSGDHIICVKNPYSWTSKLLVNFLKRFGVSHTLVDGTVAEAFEYAYQPNTKLIFLESPNSWTFEMQDIEPIASYAKEMGLLTIMDSSYATPINLNPADYGIDIIVHSSSKYIGGHSDAISGLLCGSKEMVEKIFKSEFMTLGAVISPFNAWLLLRGLRTLPLRMKQVSATTPGIVEMLESHAGVDQVYYPNSEKHPQKHLAEKYMKNPAGQFTIDLATTDESKVKTFCEALKYFKLGCSWGGYESLAFPAMVLKTSQNYSSSTAPNNRIRFYVGLEDEKVLKDDLIQALDQLK